MAAEYSSPEQELAAREFEQSRQDAGMDGGYHPRGPVTDAEIDRNLAEMDQVENATPSAPRAPENVVPIRPDVKVESVEAVTAPEVESRDYAAEHDAVFKALEANGNLSSDSNSILELSDAVNGLRPDSATYQQLHSRMLDRLISSELHITDVERAGDLLNLSLQMLENPGNSPEIVDKLDSAILTIFSQDQAKFDMAQLQKFSTIAKDRHRNDEQYFKAFDTQAAKLVGEGLAARPAASATIVETAPAPTPGPAKATEAAMPTGATKAGEGVWSYKPPVEQAGTIPTPTTAANPPVEAAAPPSPAPEAPEDNAEALRIQAEQEAAQKAELERLRTLNQLIDDTQSAWNKLPLSVKNNIDFRPLANVNGSVREYTENLRNDIAEGKRQYAHLRIGAGEDNAAREAKLLEELQMMKLMIERETKAAPEVSKGISEIDKILESKSRNMEAKIYNEISRTPALEQVIKRDPGIQKKLKQMKNKPGFFQRIFGF